MLALEYRFFGEQVKGGPNYAKLNSGVMVHSQSPESILKDQDWPISVEAQFLAGDRTTMNVCTPGTEIFMNGEMVKAHCTNSSSRKYGDEGWIAVEVEVRGGESIRHLIDGKTVLEFQKPTIGGGVANGWDPAIKKDGTLLTEGYIGLQAESQPVEFRNIRLLNLSGCMKPESPAYRPYFVHRDDSRCTTALSGAGSAGEYADPSEASDGQPILFQAQVHRPGSVGVDWRIGRRPAAAQAAAQPPTATSRQPDSLLNGILIGAGVGAIPGIYWLVADPNECTGLCAEDYAAIGVGAVVGGLIDRAITRKVTVHEAGTSRQFGEASADPAVRRPEAVRSAARGPILIRVTALATSAPLASFTLHLAARRLLKARRFASSVSFPGAERRLQHNDREGIR